MTALLAPLIGQVGFYVVLAVIAALGIWGALAMAKHEGKVVQQSDDKSKIIADIKAAQDAQNEVDLADDAAIRDKLRPWTKH